MGTTAGSDVEAGFAKLQGEDFEYYMQTYSIMLGRNSKKSTVDVDLASLGGGMNISRHHARIFYDFTRRRFALEVLGKNGCLVEGVLHLPGNPPVKLDSQDLLQIGDKEFYFLLPVEFISSGNKGGFDERLYSADTYFSLFAIWVGILQTRSDNTRPERRELMLVRIGVGLGTNVFKTGPGDEPARVPILPVQPVQQGV
ncbi:hypothetical protein CCACVL1_09392 [Corchorus capsularis]|uniref:FHA domain-containing protein n=1 Tax=Corchorus capsularis TaxID=210143 RepID=A0A1R3IWF3_COCAP|nr:hypothetical protein CCACVL1_09392 [Corchorus capsularis]